jgi:geranylgeranyl transferase type-1 subunit beta
MLGHLDLIDNTEDARFLEECFTPFGGFSKYNFIKKPDILHTFYSVAALSLACKEGFQRINSKLAIPESKYLEFINANKRDNKK